MTKKHFLLYDFLIPIGGILAIGRFLSDKFDAVALRGLDHVKPFGFGSWFSGHPFRDLLWEYSWLAFAFIPAVFWLLWVRINLEYDWVNRRRRLDRPIYTLFKKLGSWIDGRKEIRELTLVYERRLAAAEERIHRLEQELEEAYAANADSDYDDEDDEIAEAGEKWHAGYRPGAQAG